MGYVLMVGSFSPPTTGESTCNEKILHHLRENSVPVKAINSVLEVQLENTGKMSLRKLDRYIKIFLQCAASLVGARVLYLVPGQTVLGMIRGIPLVLVAKLLGKKTVLHLHGYGFVYCLSRYKWLRGFCWAYRWSDHVLVLSEDLKQKLSRFGFQRMEVVYNGVPAETDFIDLASKDFGRCRVLYLSNLIKEKGVLEVCEAARSCPAEIQFAIAGDGDPELVAHIRRLVGLRDNVDFYGRVEGGVKKALLADCTVFVLPTRYRAEGVPLAMLEAMASGMAVVVSPHHGIPEIAGDQACYVEPQNVDSLVATLIGLSNDETLVRQRATALQDLSRQYTEAKFLYQVRRHLA